MRLSGRKLEKIQEIIERDPQAYSEMEVCLLRHAQTQQRREQTSARLMGENQRELKQLRSRCRLLEGELRRLSAAVHSAAEAAGRSLADWESDRELAWIFGVLRGWEECLPQVAERFEWTPRQVQALENHAAAVQSVSEVLE